MSHEQVKKFTTELRSIKGLHLFKIFSKYLPLASDIEHLFNYLGQREKEEDLRQLEALWAEFIKKNENPNVG